MDPLAVLGLARGLADLPPQIFLVGCEPGPLPEGDEMSMELSPAVAQAVKEASEMILELAGQILSGRILMNETRPGT
jgi:Ni,Fe-hydrogenase maturation factor